MIICIFLYIAGYTIYGNLTHKDTVLCTALVNVSAGDAITKELSTDFLDYLSADTSRNEAKLYNGLYLTEDESESNVDLGYVYVFYQPKQQTTYTRE